MYWFVKQRRPEVQLNPTSRTWSPAISPYCPPFWLHSQAGSPHGGKVAAIALNGHSATLAVPASPNRFQQFQSKSWYWVSSTPPGGGSRGHLRARHCFESLAFLHVTSHGSWISLPWVGGKFSMKRKVLRLTDNPKSIYMELLLLRVSVSTSAKWGVITYPTLLSFHNRCADAGDKHP